MAHYVITIDGPPRRLSDRDAMERRLLVTGDDGESRPVRVVLTGGADAPTDDAAWRAAVFAAVEEVEIAFHGEGWGVPVEDGPALEVTTTADSIARFVGEPHGEFARRARKSIAF